MFSKACTPMSESIKCLNNKQFNMNIIFYIKLYNTDNNRQVHNFYF